MKKRAIQISLLEDDYLQSSAIGQDLEKGFLGVQVNLYETESEFRRNATAAAKANLAILDICVMWAFPNSLVRRPRPQEVIDGGFFFGGIRCAKKLQEKNPQIPIILYTILGKRLVKKMLREEGVKVAAVVNKCGDPKCKRLCAAVRQVLGRS